MDKQVKSKKRVSDHGEVFTNKREVNAMLDLVKTETERIDSRFLEPACGEGAFCVEILRRKLDVVKKNYKRLPLDYEKYSLISLMSIYGVDILEDNTQICRDNLYKIWFKEYKKTLKLVPNDRICDIAKFILTKNILCGDALSLRKNNGEPIIFAEWSFITGNKIKRRDYKLNELLEDKNKESEQLSLFDLDDNMQMRHSKELIYDAESDSFIPAPIKEYPITDYRELDKSE